MYHLLLLGEDITHNFKILMNNSFRNYPTLIDKLILKADMIELEMRL
jgi:hypothetical protein